MKMSEKKISLTQKQGIRSNGEQHLTYVEEQTIITPTAYSNLLETKNGAITFDPNYLRKIIVSIDAMSTTICDKPTDFSLVDIEEKNEINGLSQDYYDTFIAKEYEPYFMELDNFLALRENEDLQGMISNIIKTLNQEIFISRKKYNTFESMLNDIQSSLLDSQYEHLHNKVSTIQFVIYYLYSSCFIGKKTKSEQNK
jgi:C-terminal domain 12 of the ABC-three component (ABC-3C) systems